MIIINIARISSDKKNLEINIETLSNYRFKDLFIWPYTDTGIWQETVSTLNFGSFFSKINNQEIITLSFEDDLDLNGSSLYYLRFTIEWDETGEETDTPLYVDAVVADLSYSYFNKIRMINDKKYDMVIQQNIYERLFKEAISLERWEDVNKYFELVQKGINNNLIID